MRLLLISLILGSCAFAADAPQPLTPVPFNAVRLTDSFWAPRITLNRVAVVPHNIQQCEETGRISNFAKAGKLEKGEFRGIYFDDSDVYKMIEGAAYTLALQPDPELQARIEAIIDKIASAQQPDGYLYTFYTVRNELHKRWTDTGAMHELYCAGHLIEAAIAWHQATGQRKFLDVAVKLADHIDSIFGPDKRHDVPGHEEIELALFKLGRHVNEPRYTALATFFINERGHKECGRKLQGEYSLDDMPLRQRTEVAGHAVRAMYLFCGAADLAALTGEAALIRSLDTLWHDVVDRKMYVTGGIGPSAHNEGFTVAYDLPNDSAYAETCASIGLVLWSTRMAVLTGDAKYMDAAERSMYNGVLSGVGIDGKSFFYVNRLASRGKDRRVPWFGCACCPPNIARFLPSVGGYLYATRGDNIYVNIYANSESRIRLGDNLAITATQETAYPWDGSVRLRFDAAQPRDFTVRLRIPSWCGGASVGINGRAVANPVVERGYLVLRRQWQPADVVELNLPMPVRRVYAHPNVKDNVGRVALQRGPIIYCLEQADNPGGVRHLSLPKDAPLTIASKADLFTGCTVIKGAALSHSRGTDPKPVEFTAVPYHLWANREPGQMIVWIAEDPGVAEVKPAPTIASTARASASHTWHMDTLEALSDQAPIASSADHGCPRFTWWDKKGGTQWVQYDLANPAKVSSVEVYWFDDTGQGGCRVPASWRLLYKAGNDWKPVENPSAYGVKKDAFNRVTFAPVETSALRIEVQLQPDFSGGILEWRVE